MRGAGIPQGSRHKIPPGKASLSPPEWEGGRDQKTVLDELYATIDVKGPDLDEELGCYEHYYNWERAHGARKGKTPMDRYFDESSKTPFRDAVEAVYDPSKEHFRAQNYQSDRKLKKLRDS